MNTRIGFPRSRIGTLFVLAALPLFAWGTWDGLVHAPPDHYMGDVQRIMYVHVPTAWIALVALLAAFVAAVGYLATRRDGFDALLEATTEVGVVLAGLLCIQGSLWAKPTWGVWWDWDPRLTSVAVMLLAFIGVLGLRRLVTEPRRRAVWSSAATIIAFADVPIVYFSVRWWNSLHQMQSTPQTVDAAMVTPLRVNAIAMLLLAIGLTLWRGRLAALRLQAEATPLPAPIPLLNREVAP